MPTISIFYGIVIQMFWREHGPPHFHALYAEHEALIDLIELRVIFAARSLDAPWHWCWNGPLNTAMN